jgi:hypothetical protein
MTLKDKINNFVLQHFEDFEAMPMDIEIDDKIYDWDEYQKYITKETRLKLESEFKRCLKK